MEMTRRELLKLVAAGSGAVAAAAIVPEKWTRPLVKAGVLPVHAQTSGTVVLSELVIILNLGQNATYKLAAPARNNSGTQNCLFTFKYHDLLKQMDDTALIYASVYKQSGWVNFVDGQSLASLSANIDPYGTPASDPVESGVVTVHLLVPTDAINPYTCRLILKIKGRPSNEIEAKVTED
jgi:hypothetical protein